MTLKEHRHQRRGQAVALAETQSPWSFLALDFFLFSFLNSFIEVQLTYKKLHIIKIDNLMSSDIYPHP